MKMEKREKRKHEKRRLPLWSNAMRSAPWVSHDVGDAARACRGCEVAGYERKKQREKKERKNT